MNNISKIVIASDNPDWNGVFFKDEVIQDMIDLDYQPDDENDWIGWVLFHMFIDLPGVISNAIESGLVTIMTFDLEGYGVAVKIS